MSSPRTGRTRDSSLSSLIAPSDSISLMQPRRKRSETIKLAAKPTGGGKRCQKCGDGLQGRRFIERDGVRLCERDWKEMFLPKVSSPLRRDIPTPRIRELTPCTRLPVPPLLPSDRDSRRVFVGRPAQGQVASRLLHLRRVRPSI
jgi:hypothetical protein